MARQRAWANPQHSLCLEPHAMRLRVVTWNIHKGIGGVDRRYQLDRTAAVLAELHPDIALLQEVAEGMPRCGMHNQLEELSRDLKLNHVAFGAEHRFRVG